MTLRTKPETSADEMEASDWSTSMLTDSEEDVLFAMPGVWAAPPKLPRKSSQRTNRNSVIAQSDPHLQPASLASSQQAADRCALEQQGNCDSIEDSAWVRDRRLSSLFSGLGFDGFGFETTTAAIPKSISLASTDSQSLAIYAMPLDADSESEQEHFHSADESLSLFDVCGLSNPTKVSASSSLASLTMETATSHQQSILPLATNSPHTNSPSDIVPIKTQAQSVSFNEMPPISAAMLVDSVQEIEQAAILRERYLAQIDGISSGHDDGHSQEASTSLSDETSATTPTLSSTATSADGSRSATSLESLEADDFDMCHGIYRDIAESVSPSCSAAVKFANSSPRPSMLRPRLRGSKSIGTFGRSAVGSQAPAKSRNAPSTPSKRRRSQSIAVSQPITNSLRLVSTEESSPRLFHANTFRSQFNALRYEALAQEFGQIEMKRQECIWELCQTETSFVLGLQQICETFLNPLRTPHGRWIKGIPTSISRLFDWLDDIVHLHSELDRALSKIHRSDDNMVERFADTFLAFVPHLEVHLPYLACFEKVASLIDGLVNDTNSDFGEFVRMQEALPACGSMPLTSFLLKPVQRIMKYPLFFKQLSQVTPPEHSDHVASLALLHSTDTIIRIMQEVKAREDEYAEIKNIQASLKGLPEGFTLAQRDRKLLKRGTLKQLHIPSSERHLLGTSHSPLLNKTSPKPAGHHAKAMRRSISIQRSDMTIGLGVFDSGQSLLKSDEVVLPQRPLRSLERPSLRNKVKETSIEVIIFSDVVVFAARQAEPLRVLRGNPKKQLEPQFKAIDNFGVCRILAVQLHQMDSADPVIELDLLPIASDAETQSISLCNASLATSIFVSPPAVQTIASPSMSVSSIRTRIKTSPTPQPHQEEAHDVAQWSSALEQCHHSVLRSLSFPSNLHSLAPPIQCSNSLSFMTHDDGPDINRISYGSVLDSGLPMPKSASQQDFMERLGRSLLPAPADVEQEREERGWWAMRFKKVRSDWQAEEAARAQSFYQLGNPSNHHSAPRPIRLHSLASRSALDLKQRAMTADR